MNRRCPLMRWDASGFQRKAEPDSPGFLVVTSAREFESAYETLAAGASPPDLTSHVLVAVHRGLCRSGGFAVRILEVRVTPFEVIVKARFKDPGPDEVVTLAMTYPVDAALIPKRLVPARTPVVFRLVDPSGRELQRREAVIVRGGR